MFEERMDIKRDERILETRGSEERKQQRKEGSGKTGEGRGRKSKERVRKR